MQFTRYEWMMLVYNFAAVLSGAYVAWTLDISDRMTLIGISFGIAIAWTVYFRFVLLGRLVEHPRIADEYDDEEETLHMG